MFNPFETNDRGPSGSVKEPVNNLYSVYDGKDKRIMSGVSLLEFTLFIEVMTLEESSEYTLVPIRCAEVSGAEEEAAEYSLVPVGKRWGE